MSTVLVDGSSQSWLELDLLLDEFLSRFAARLHDHEDLTGRGIEMAGNLSVSLNAFRKLLGKQKREIDESHELESAFYRAVILPLTLKGTKRQFNMHTLASASTFSRSADIELKNMKIMLRNMLTAVRDMQVCNLASFQHLPHSEQMRWLLGTYF